MAQQRTHNHSVHQIVLPSGKAIDAVCFNGETRVERDLERLEHCAHCGHDRVHPVAWSEADETSWAVTLRCPDCESTRDATFAQDVLDRFDIALDEGTRAIASDLDLLTRANMAEDVERFLHALDAGHIVPEDF